jgi:hypothetical protein
MSRTTARRPRPCVLTIDATVPADMNGVRYCTCGAPENHERHTLPSTSSEQHDVEARRLGERED